MCHAYMGAIFAKTRGRDRGKRGNAGAKLSDFPFAAAPLSSAPPIPLPSLLPLPPIRPSSRPLFFVKKKSLRGQHPLGFRMYDKKNGDIKGPVFVAFCYL